MSRTTRTSTRSEGRAAPACSAHVARGQGAVLGHHVPRRLHRRPRRRHVLAERLPRAEPGGRRARRQIGALLIGRRTFGGDDPNKGTENQGAFEGEWTGPQFVLTHHPLGTPSPNVTFVSDLGTAVSAAKEAAGERYVNVLGADVARQCLAAGVLDEVLVCIAPLLLGDGVRLFEHPGGAHVKLERLSLTSAPLATNLWMGVVR